MTRDQLDSIQSVAFGLADGVAVVFPVSPPFVAAIEAIVKAAEDHGIVPYEMSAEQAAAIAAGMAAHDASKLTEFKARRNP